MKGRKAKPTALKLLSGTAQPCRTNKQDMKSEKLQKAPPPPKWFSAIAKKIYKDTTRQLLASKVLTPSDLQMLVAYCQEYANYLEIMEKFQPDKEGNLKEERIVSTETKRGTFKQVNPLLKIAQSSLEKAKSIGVEFGLTPSSRSRVSPVKEQDEDDFVKFLKNRTA